MNKEDLDTPLPMGPMRSHSRWNCSLSYDLTDWQLENWCLFSAPKMLLMDARSHHIPPFCCPFLLPVSPIPFMGSV